jgi:hypothetical protein
MSSDEMGIFFYCRTPRLSSGLEKGETFKAFYEKPRFSCYLLQADDIFGHFSIKK